MKASGSCSADSIRSSSNVKIEFDLPPAQTYSKIVLDLSLTEPDQQSGFWSVDKATATLTTVAGVQTLTLKSEPIESLQNFSYSCNRQLFTSDINGEPITLEFERFQLQGFEGDVFNESFDCASWFTLGMWMSLLFILLFVTIVTLGVCFIVSVQTNDRFEDPRGKPLYVPNTD